MRKVLFASLTVVALGALPVFAQSEEEGGGEGAEGSATVSPGEGSGRADAPGAQHTVERGDTLWDLSQRYLGSPWYWPKVWSYNPEIANPHWIYPGNLVRFYSSGEEVPTEVEVGQPETPEIEEGQMIEDDDKVIIAGKIGFRPKASVNLLSPGFITSQEIEEAGVIAGSFAERELLSFPEKIYGRFDKAGTAKVGQRYLIFRNMGEVLHPETNRPIGVYTRLVGEVKVVSIDKPTGLAIMQIVRQQDDMVRGDLIGPAGEDMMRVVAARPNERDVKDAMVVAAPNRALTNFAEHQFLIMDKGSDDGVKAGNVFTIWRAHDPLPQEALLNPNRIDDRFPREDVGQCVAFEVKSKVTICLVSRSIRELVRGDHAEVRAGGTRSASR